MDNCRVPGRTLQLRLLCLCAVTLCLPACADDWSQFLGQARDGRSDESGLARQWPDGGPRELWNVGVGPGFGGASIRDGEVFLLDRADDAQDVLRCFDLASGAELWRFENDVPGRLDYNGSRSTPTVTKRHVFALGPLGHLYCVDRRSHELVWMVDLMATFGSSPPRWGFAASPLLYDETVIVPSLADEVGLVAFDVDDGRPLWQSGNVGGESYCSPAIHRIGKRDVAMYLSPQGLYAIDARNGKQLLHYAGYQCSIPITAPTALGKGAFFLTGGYETGSVLIQLKAKGRGLAITEIFRLDRDGAQIHQPILFDGHLYANFNEGGQGRGPVPGLTCLSLDGRARWAAEDSPSVDRGSLILVDGLLLSLSGQDGVLRLLEADPDGYSELASARVFENGENAWAPMAFADGKLLLRSQSALKCLDLIEP